MNVHLSNAFRNIKRDLENENIEQAKNNFNFISNQLMEFLTEVRDRKEEGEVVIDELVTVLCLEDEPREWFKEEE